MTSSTGSLVEAVVPLLAVLAVLVLAVLELAVLVVLLLVLLLPHDARESIMAPAKATDRIFFFMFIFPPNSFVFAPPWGEIITTALLAA
jgi:hypothetical protein